MRELVTEADTCASDTLHDALAKRFPNDGWLGEEHTDTDDRRLAQRVWSGRPDRRHARVPQGLQSSAVSIGLVIDGEPALGVVYNPAAGTMMAACCIGAEEREPKRRQRSTTCSSVGEKQSGVRAAVAGQAANYRRRQCGLPPRSDRERHG